MLAFLHKCVFSYILKRSGNFVVHFSLIKFFFSLREAETLIRIFSTHNVGIVDVEV